MKIRNGFVSNSSSMSFMVKQDNYPNTIAVATHALEIMINQDKKDADEIWYEKHASCLTRLNSIRELGVEPNIPLWIEAGDHGFSTFIYHGIFLCDVDRIYMDELFDEMKDAWILWEGASPSDINYYYIDDDVFGKLVTPYEESNDPKVVCGDENHAEWVLFEEYRTNHLFCWVCGKNEEYIPIKVSEHPEMFKKIDITIELNKDDYGDLKEQLDHEITSYLE